LSFEAADTFETTGACRELLYFFDATWEECELADIGGRWRRFMRLKEVFPNRPTVQVRAVAEDACGGVRFRPDNAEEKITFDLTGSNSVPLTRTFRMSERTAWTLGTKLEFPALGLTLAAELRGQRAFTTMWEYRLPAGAKYVAYRPQNAPAWLWSTLPKLVV
jgi:hypothetical protein